MKVIYHDTIIERIKDAVSNARKNGRHIKKILLTKEEMYRLHSEEDFWFNPEVSIREGRTFMGIPIEEDELSGPKPKDEYDKMVLAARACGLSDEMIYKIMISKPEWEFIKLGIKLHTQHK